MKAPKKLQRKHITVQAYNLEKQRVAESQYKKWQLKICKWIGVEPADKQQYLFQIKYKGNTRIEHGDVIANKQGVMFGVIQENNRSARVVTLDGFIQKPNMNGTFFLIEKNKKKPNIEPIK